jgi:type II secretion system protein H
LKALHCNSGFTLIEIAAVLVIIAILSTLAVTHMGGSKISLYGEADHLVADLRYAQTIAMTRAPDGGEVTVKIEGDGWYLLNNKDKDEEDKELWFADGKRDFWEVKDDSVTIAPNIDITFTYPKGAVDLGELDYQDIVLTRGNKSITIRVYDETGYVEIYDE